MTTVNADVREVGLSALNARQEDYHTREEWLLGRRLSVGASETPTLFGVGYANQSPISIYESKLSNSMPEALDAKLAKRLRIGKQMEPVLRDIFYDETGMVVFDAGEFAIYRHPDYPFLSASLDGLCYNPELDSWCVVELKNVHHFNRDEWDDEENPPLKYAVQVQQQLAVTGLPCGYLLGLIGGQEPIVMTIQRNDVFIEESLIPTAQRFWQCVESRTLPDVDASEATKKALQRLFPEGGEEILLPEDALIWDTELQAIKSDLKTMTERKDLLENKLKACLGTASIGLIPAGGSYTYKTQNRKGFIVEPTTFRALRRSSK